MEETKTATMEGDKSDGKNMNKKNKGEREEEKTKIQSSSLGKPPEVVEKPHNKRWLALTLLEHSQQTPYKGVYSLCMGISSKNHKKRLTTDFLYGFLNNNMLQ
jgi:hypothetical protein